MSNIKHTAFSIRNPAKQRCGDASFTGEIEVSGERIILLLVADGVSKAPKDWLASKSAIDLVVTEIQKSNKLVPDALKEAIETANRKICAGVENTYGMLTTLSAVVYHPLSEQLFWCNIGDSRIYGLKNNQWHQLSNDDIASMPYKENGKLKLQNGLPIMISGITKALGQDLDLQIEIQKIDTNEYKAFGLASDGFYELTGFSNYATEITVAADIESKALKIQSDIISEIRDDVSFALIRLPGKKEFNLRLYLNEADSSDDVPVEVTEVLEQEIKQSVLNQDDEYLGKIIEFMKTNKLFYSKSKMIELLEFMIEKNNPLVKEMTLIIRKMI